MLLKCIPPFSVTFPNDELFSGGFSSPFLNNKRTWLTVLNECPETTWGGAVKGCTYIQAGLFFTKTCPQLISVELASNQYF